MSKVRDKALSDIGKLLVWADTIIEYGRPKKGKIAKEMYHKYVRRIQALIRTY